jgi:tetratricopeptide (TPR) repeat protein
VAVVFVGVHPFWSSLQQVRLLGRTDTRVEARHWMEANIPAGTPIANFGGWAGDIGARSFEQLWWEVSLFERRFGRDRLQPALEYLQGQAPVPPYYSYGIQRTNQESAAGSFAEIERLETPFVVLHRHPLSFSTIDSAFAVELARRGKLLFSAKVEDLWSPEVRFDWFDAFYLPVSGDLQRPGPEIEIWQIADCPVPVADSFSFRKLFSMAYAPGVAETLQVRGAREAAVLLQRARMLDAANPEVYFIAAYFAQKADKAAEAVGNYRRFLTLQPTNATAYNNLAALYESTGETALAEASLLHQLRLAPWKRSALLALAGFYRRQEEYSKVVQFYQVLTARFAGYAEDHLHLGLTHEQLGNHAAAESAYRRALEIDAASARAHLLLARLYRSEQRIADMVAVCQDLLAADPSHLEAHKLLAYGLRYMGQQRQAAYHARRAIALAPEDSTLAPLRRWLKLAGDL